MIGAEWLGGGRVRFRVWAPLAKKAEVLVAVPVERRIPLEAAGAGHFEAVADGLAPGARYFFRLDDREERPDPASRSQPDGVHRASEVVESAFPWRDAGWRGIALPDHVFYEIHIGTFTPEGTFDAAAGRLDDLRALGVTAVELMPVAQFPGARNWGYDGVHPFAPQNTYGRSAGLKRFVEACHLRGLAAVLDVVYNHLGPEGNYLAEFGPYFSDRCSTPWGPAVNLDGPDSDEVRRFFIENALYWIEEFHFDGLRLDATHAMFDRSPQPFLRELADAVRAAGARLGRSVFLFPEDNRNDARLVRPAAAGGLGLDAVWTEDLRHALHSLLTNDRAGPCEDFGSLGILAKTLREGFGLTGEYSRYRRRRFGGPSDDLPPFRFVSSVQNHDHIGNRGRGERLASLVGLEGLKLAAGAVLHSPFLPLLFMGEEYGETAPFPFFTSYLDEGLADAVRRGRRAEYAASGLSGVPPDPQAESTFERSRLDASLRNREPNRTLLEWHRELLRLRREIPALSRPTDERQETGVLEPASAVFWRRRGEGSEAFGILSFGEAPSEAVFPLPAGGWRKILDSAEARWNGPGSPLPARLRSDGPAALRLPARAYALYVREPGA